MELNTKGRYAVTAMADLAKFSVGEAIPLSGDPARAYVDLVTLGERLGAAGRAI